MMNIMLLRSLVERMSPTIEHCCSNETGGLLSTLPTHEAKVVERRCLEHCGICRRRPFAVVDGEVVFDETASHRSNAPGPGGDA